MTQPSSLPQGQQAFPPRGRWLMLVAVLLYLVGRLIFDDIARLLEPSATDSAWRIVANWSRIVADSGFLFMIGFWAVGLLRLVERQEKQLKELQETSAGQNRPSADRTETSA
jgi:hypothetical protein